MRILYLNPISQMGGAETTLLQLLISIGQAQPSWSLHLLMGTLGPLAQRASFYGVQTTVLPFPAELGRLGDSALKHNKLSTVLTAMFKAIRYLSHLRSFISALNPDIIHTTGFKMHLLAVYASPSRTPIIWHIHDYVTSRHFMRKLLRWHSSRCSVIIANSQSVRLDVQRVCDGLRVVTLYNSVDLEKFSPNGPIIDLDAASSLPPSGEVFRIGLMATFAKWKGHGVFLRALSLLNKHQHVRGYIIGGPIYQTVGSQHTVNELKTEVERLGLSGKVGFTGFVDEPASALRALDIVVHASTQPEPFGMVIVEGMACGKPVIATATSGAGEIFEDGRTVLVYQSGNAQALADCIETLIDQPELRASLGTSARRSVEKILDGKRLASEVAAIYNELTVSDCGQIRETELGNIQDPKAAVL